MFKEHEINKERDKFICGYYIPDEIIDPIIEWCSGLDLYPASTWDATQDKIKRWDGESNDVKECFEQGLLWPTINVECMHVYLDAVQSCLEMYKNQYAPLQTGGAFKMDPSFNFQKYPKGGSYNSWHSERACVSSARRMLVWMTYLNECEDGGETAFLYQKYKMTPEKGLHLFWPSDWTHTHRGLTSHKTEKMILTGWYSYIREGEQLEWN